MIFPPLLVAETTGLHVHEPCGHSECNETYGHACPHYKTILPAGQRMFISPKTALIPGENSATTVKSCQVLCALLTGVVAEVSVLDGAFSEKATADFVSLWSYATNPMRPDPVDARRAVLMWNCDDSALMTQNVAAISWLLSLCAEGVKDPISAVMSPVGMRICSFYFFCYLINYVP